MALQSEVSPPMVGDPNTVRNNEGTKSDENDPSQSTDEDVDLEDGEILDSGAEEEEEKDFTNSSLKEALDKNLLLNIEQLVNQAKAKTIGSPNHSKVPTPRKLNKMSANYLDHDRNENSSDHDDGWVPKFKQKFDDKPIDYRMELAAYRGTPPSSPDRKRRDEKTRKKKSSKKSKKSRKTIKRKDIKGLRVKHRDVPRGKICKFFKEGKCVKGADCLFSHPTPFKKKELCKFYLNGHCNKGKDCLYMHSDFPCKFYHTGSECYARDDCRFSHAPLTDEMKRVLADYLRMSHGDDVRLNRDDRDDERGRDRERDRDRDRDRERKRHISRSPENKAPPPKRACLLGSPPRHIREAEETKLWQEEMKMLQSQNHPGFEIHLSPDHDNMSPSHFPKPNFYNETLLNTPSPKRRQGSAEESNAYHSNSMDDYDEGSPSKVYVYDEDEFIEITVPPVKKPPPEEYIYIQKSEESQIKSYDETPQQELDFTNDIKFDETTQFSEMESSYEGPPALSPNQENQYYNDSKDSDDTSNQEDIKYAPEKPSEDANGDSSQESSPPPSIVVPSHLPRRQQELLMRVLQHQRKNPAAGVMGSPSGGDNTENSIKKEEPAEEEEEEKSESVANDSKWYSSEDDDDDFDQPLTDVLKKIQQAPPAKPSNPESKPSVNILDMFNKIQQKTMENKGLAKSSPQPANAFWANILQGAAPKPAVNPNSNGEQKRRTLLPDPTVPIQKIETPAVKEPAIIIDPRLKKRDPRKLPTAVNPPVSVPKSSIDENVSDNSPSLQDANPLFSLPLGKVTGESTKDKIPYRLRGISANPPNYTPYLNASQSNPNLLKDPRLRKHLLPSSDESIRNGKDHEPIKPAPKDAPPIPELLLKYQKPVSAINIFESSSSTKRPADTTKQESKPSLPKSMFDPRMRRRDSRSNSNSSSDTPPHLTIVDSITTPPQQEFKTAPVLENAMAEPIEKKWLPPVLEKSWTASSLEKNWTSLSMKEAPTLDVKEEPTLCIKEEPTLCIKEPTLCIKEEPIEEPVVKVEKIDVKEEPSSDTESNHDPPKLEVRKDSYKKSPSPPLKEEFITVVKTEVSQDSNNDSRPVVPPLIIKKVKPTVASHLPRAIADPRMANLHNRVDPRRHRTTGPDAKSLVERKKPAKVESKVSNDLVDESKNIPETKNSDAPKASKSTESVSGKEKDEKPKEVKTSKEEKVKSSKSIPKKRRLSDKGEEKRRTVHRNRKSSMDYASPLNSCDATNTNKSLDYNSYNQRPKRTVSEKPPTIDAAASLPDLSDTSSIPDFALSDSSNLECDNSNDVNLKDRFKTIDPTASPFC